MVHVWPCGTKLNSQSYCYSFHNCVGTTTCVKSRTAKEAGHRRCIGSKHLCDVALGAFLFLLRVNTLRHKHGGHIRWQAVSVKVSQSRNANFHLVLAWALCELPTLKFQRLQHTALIRTSETKPQKTWHFAPVTHQSSLQLEYGRCAQPTLWGHLPPPAPATECVWGTLQPVELPADQGGEFPAFGVTFGLPLCTEN